MDQTWWGLIGFIAVCFAVASTASMSRPTQWYYDLDKPSWTPRDWVFPVVWTTLYAMIAVSGWLVWQAVGLSVGAFAIYAGQLLLNALWSPIFFRWHKMGLATVEAGLFWVAVLLNILVFWPISETAALLLVPYLMWVTVAFALTASIWRRNRPGAPARQTP